MGNKGMRLLMVVAVLFFMTLPTQAEESGAIDVQLTVLKVEPAEGTQEVLVPAETIRPGDVLQYEIVYKIKGQNEVLELLAQFPIPEGMEYVLNSARPTKVLVSLNGIDFSPIPLPDKVKLVDGQEVREKIPVVKYRTLGWAMRGLAPGDEFTVSARLKVDFIPDPK